MLSLLLNTSHYYPFGMRMSQRSSNSSEYRYGFNGMEKDDEIKGEGNSYDFGARIYDPRIGRFLSTDKYSSKFPNQSPYIFASNSPIIAIDNNGDSTYVIIYGASWLNAASQGQSHDVGKGFEKSAEAAALKITNSKNFDPNRDAVVVVYAPSTEKFIDAANKEYETGKIAALYVFSHGTADGISLGGEANSMDQYGDYDLREINSYNLFQLDKDNFEPNSKCTLNGCNIGSGGEISFAQELADYLDATVKAFDNYSEFKSENGDGKSAIYDGEMIKSVDRKTQQAKFTTFTKGEEPKNP